MLNKLASSIQMSFEVPEQEKEIASNTKDLFWEVLRLLTIGEDHLEKMYNVFQKHENIPIKSVKKYIGVISRYKEVVKENYEKIMQASAEALNEFDFFSSDTQTLEILNSFESSIKDVEKQIEIFLEAVEDYESDNFRNGVIKGIEGVKKQSAQVENLVKERIIEHIDANILAKDWIADTNSDLKDKMKERDPMVTRLFQERQNALESATSGNGMVQPSKKEQSLNPSDAASIRFPTDFGQS